MRFVLKIPVDWLHIIVMLLLIVFVADFSLAFRAALDLRDVIIAYEQLKEEFDRLEKRMDVVLAFAQDDRDKAKMRFAERMDEIEKRIDEVIESNMSPETREKFREQIEEFKKNSNIIMMIL